MPELRTRKGCPPPLVELGDGTYAIDTSAPSTVTVGNIMSALLEIEKWIGDIRSCLNQMNASTVVCDSDDNPGQAAQSDSGAQPQAQSDSVVTIDPGQEVASGDSGCGKKITLHFNF